MKYHPIAKELFIENRRRFKSRLDQGASAIFNSNDEMPRCGDANFPFRQQSDIFYLSGIDQELRNLSGLSRTGRPLHNDNLIFSNSI